MCIGKKNPQFVRNCGLFSESVWKEERKKEETTFGKERFMASVAFHGYRIRGKYVGNMTVFLRSFKQFLKN